MEDNKFCEFCGNKVHIDAVMCPKCGRQIGKLKVDVDDSNPQIIINNAVNSTVPYSSKECEKWVAFVLCLFLGFFGAHKFYEGKIGLGILYLFTAGLFGIGWFVDIIIILCNSDPYYV